MSSPDSPDTDKATSSTVFDHLSRSVGSQATRRDALKTMIVGLGGIMSAGLGFKNAAAATQCLCGRQLFNPETQCCVAGIIQTKYPITNLNACPSREGRPGRPQCEGNGCGEEGGFIRWPSKLLKADILSCCNGHDCCWDECKADRSACDNAFENCMVKSCEATYPPDMIGGIGGQIDVNRFDRDNCLLAARSYAFGVRTDRWGTKAYVKAQQVSCNCCGTQTCLTCPGGTCASLPGCGSSGCVCFQTVEGNGFCHRPQLCAGLPTCSSSQNCPDGWACVSVTCCGSTSICIQPCQVPQPTLVSPRGRPLTGPMTDGSTA